MVNMVKYCHFGTTGKYVFLNCITDVRMFFFIQIKTVCNS